MIQTVEALVNPFADKHEGDFSKMSQEKASVESIDDPLVMEALSHYRSFTARTDTLPILTPQQIECVLQTIISRYDRQTVERLDTGKYLSALIGASMAGNAEGRYQLTVGEYEIQGLPYGLVTDNKTALEIVSDCGNLAGASCQNLDLCIRGCAGGYLGNEISDSQVTVFGDVGYDLGRESVGSVFRVYGNAGNSVGYCSRGSVFIIHGKIDHMFNLDGAQGCTLKLLDKESFEYAANPGWRNNCNKVQLIDKHENVLKEVRL